MRTVCLHACVRTQTTENTCSFLNVLRSRKNIISNTCESSRTHAHAKVGKSSDQRLSQTLIEGHIISMLAVA